MERLSGLDASFLYIESLNQPLPFVSQPGADVQTRVSFVVPDRALALHTI
jgi:hypothetical protein